MSKKGLKDFGEHIPGAKKETYFHTINLKDEDVKKLPLSKLWNDKEVKAIQDIKIASIAHTLRDSLPKKPKTRSKLVDWFYELESAQDIVKDLLEHNKPEHTEQVLQKLQGTSYFAREGNKAYLLAQLDREYWRSIGKVQISNGRLSVEINGLRQDFNSNINVINSQDSNELVSKSREIIDSSIESIKELVVAGKKQDKENSLIPANKFDVYYYRSKDGAFITVHADRKKSPLITFESRQEAWEYRSNPDNLVELNRLWATHKELNSIHKSDMRNPENEERTGASYRDNDITPEQFMETFGIRGGQFGNWVNDDERQKILNATYDGFMDLAKALNIEPKAIGLNGTLGIAFGARGQGWASAHYEQGEKVINLTKTRGAGSLAHEWWHALDHYMGESTLLSKQLPSKTEPNAHHPEIVQPVNNLVEAIKKSELYSRSLKADDYRSHNYFSTNAEMTARAFETFIIQELKVRGIKNDFLANVRSENNWSKNESSYPYPKQNELETFAQVYKQVFDTLKEVDKEFIPVEYAPEEIIHADTVEQKDFVSHEIKTNEINTTENDIFKVPTDVQEKFNADVERLDTTLVSYPKPIQTPTPPILLALDGHQNLSVKDIPLSIDKHTLRKIKGEIQGKQDENHSLTLEEIKQSLQELYNPIAVIKADNNKDLIAITELHDKSDKPVIAILHLDKQNGRYTVNEIASMYGRNNFENWINKRIDQKQLVYFNNEKSPDLVRLLQQQLSEVVHQKGINEYNILKPEDIVKRYNEIIQQKLEPSISQSQKSSLDTNTPSEPTISSTKEYNVEQKDFVSHEIVGFYLEQNGFESKEQNNKIVIEKQDDNARSKIASQNTYINVPYIEKNQAKALGAKWDNNQRSWYIPAGAEIDKFSRWLPESQEKKQIQNHAQNQVQNQSQNNRHYLYSTPAQAGELKALGARYDVQNRAWYTTEQNKDKFSQYLSRPNIPTHEELLAEHMKSQGIHVPVGHPIFDNKPHRLANDGSQDKNVMYHAILNENNGIPYATITNFSRNGEPEKWTYPLEYVIAQKNIETVERLNGNVNYTRESQVIPSPKVDYSQAVEAQQKEKAETYDKMAELSKIVMSFSPIADKHNYLDKKQVTSNQVVHVVPDKSMLPEQYKDVISIANDWREAGQMRNNNPDNKLILQRGSLLVPQYNLNGELRAFETISYNGSKYALKDGEKKGLSLELGDVKNAPAIILAEGYATGATLHEQAHIPVVVVFGKNNFDEVALVLRDKYPDKRIYISADNDHDKEAKGLENVGIKEAMKVAEKIQANVLIPRFNVGDNGKDWNDVYVDKGLDEFKSQLKSELNRNGRTVTINSESTQNISQSQQSQELKSKIDLSPERIERDYPNMSDDNKAKVQEWNAYLASYNEKTETSRMRLEALLSNESELNKLPTVGEYTQQKKSVENVEPVNKVESKVESNSKDIDR